MNRVCVGRRGLDLSKEVLWVSVCQRAAKLPAGKVGGLKKNSAMRPGAGESVSVQESSSTFKTFYLQSKYPYFNRAYVVSSGLGCPYLYVEATVKGTLYFPLSVY